jgi:hypothetical protein
LVSITDMFRMPAGFPAVGNAAIAVSASAGEEALPLAPLPVCRRPAAGEPASKG